MTLHERLAQIRRDASRDTHLQRESVLAALDAVRDIGCLETLDDLLNERTVRGYFIPLETFNQLRKEVADGR